MSGQIDNGIIYMETPVWKYMDFGRSAFKMFPDREVERFGYTFYTSTYICPSCHKLLLKSNVQERVVIRTNRNTKHSLTSVFLCPQCDHLFAAAFHKLRLSDGQCWFLNGHERVIEVASNVEKVAAKIMFNYPAYGEINGVFHHPTQITLEEMTVIGLQHLKEENYQEAVRWLDNAAELGFVEAQYNLACIYYNGEGMEQNYEAAAYWLFQAAHQGYAAAQDQLAYMYETGMGVEKDDREAIKWWQCAAEQGFAEAEYMLGRILAKHERYLESINWLIKAASKGDQRAKELLGKLSGK